MKKFLLALLTVLCAACVGMFVACNEVTEFEGERYEGTYYNITFEKVEGITYDCEVKSGAIVLDGYTVKFSLTLNPDLVGTPVVKVNGKALQADENGEYSFKMTKDTDVKIDGVYLQKYYAVTFDEGDGWVSYITEEGKDYTRIKAGEIIEFGLKISPYCRQVPYSAENLNGYKVIANTQVLQLKDGKYSAVVTSDMTISVDNLLQVPSFINRNEDTSEDADVIYDGSGTYDDPYKIREPIDLYYLSQLVNLEDYAYYGFSTAYYELMNDIDMQGEKLYVIGDCTSDYAYFAGTFNGNGHTISNYVMDNKIIDQSTGADVYLPYVGLFGYAAAVSGKSPEIYNLNLKDFYIYVDAMHMDSMSIVGGVVGASIGANITACSAEGKIDVVAQNGYFAYAGGIAGIHQSAYDEDSTIYYATVISCNSNVELNAISGYAYAFGGIVGYMISDADKATALVLNSYSVGSVSGSMYAGGIVGKAESNTSIINCYSTGDVSSASRISDSLHEDYAKSYAGGITGYADYNSVISDCFALGTVYATSKDYKYVYSNSNVGKETDGKTFAGYLVGSLAQTNQVINSADCVMLNCYGSADKVTFNNDFFKNTLGWDSADWVFDGEYPTTNLDATSKTFNITINYDNIKVNGKTANDIEVIDTYIPMSYWYVITDESTSEYTLAEYVIADNGNRSYGYYFDKELTKKVPYSFVPTKDVTLYAGFADYSEVSGRYYIKADKKGSGAYLELSKDGTLKFVNGARSLETTYSYDGKNVFLFDVSIAALGGFDNVIYDDGTTLKDYADTYYYTYKATVNGGVMSICDVLFYIAGENELSAVKEISGFAYGSYYDIYNEYVFNTDGTGVVKGTADESFTFTVSGDTLTVNRQDIKIEDFTLSNGIITELWNGKVSVFDNFKGVWETNANSKEIYEFDGKGNYVYTNSNGNETEGTYTIAEGVLTAGNKTFKIENGNIILTFDSKTDILYSENSFVGTWYFNGKKDQVEISFNGLNQGKGTANIVSKNYEYDATYEAVTDGRNITLNIYSGDFLFATLAYNKENNYLKGSVYSATAANYIENSVFCLYDEFKGEWITDDYEISAISFNGLGLYDLTATDAYYKTYGKATVVARSDNKRHTVSYSFNYKTMTGEIVFGNNNYYYSYDRYTDALSIRKTVDLVDTDFVHYDEWRKVTLVDDNGVQYTFDGKGNLKNGGTVKIGTDSYSYQIVSYGLLIKNKIGIEYSRIKINDDGFYYETVESNNNETILYTESDFTGDWLINKNNGKMSIGKINAYGKASGTYKGNNVTYVFEDDYAYFEYEGKTVYVYLLTVGKELGLVISDEKDMYTSTVCIKDGTQDTLFGTYNSVSSNGSITFDGLGKSDVYNGTVILKDKDGKVISSYEYSFLENGKVQIKASRSEKYLFIECDSNGDGAYEVGDKYYRLAKIDYLYEAYVIDTNGTRYDFDGIGNLTVTYADNTTATFGYEITAADGSLYVITIKISGGELNGKIAKIYYGLGIGKYTISFVEENADTVVEENTET